MAASACPLGHSVASSAPAPSKDASATSACPLGHTAASSSKEVPPVPAPAAPAAQPAPTPQELLSRERVQSTIPSANGEAFFYPSEKQFYGAATAKGHDLKPEDMNMVVSIHNAVNEQAWREILKYERLHIQECPTPKLMRFIGRPGEISPKARFTGFLGRTAPFDRHDWHVDRCGSHVRYLVDFYDGKPSATHTVSIHIDARPEVSFGGIKDRLRLWAQGMKLF
mmetsp:Transcript_137078/g.292774  ORF Transcript_137078/g.292774 Transcript_137078/m.292774 type:complete len:225 (-) Transcript_137078:71-745(-)